MKFDMGRAWSEATTMLAANKELLAIIAGIFVFLPSLILGVVAPEIVTGPAEINPNDATAALREFYTTNGLWILLVSIINAVGSLALFALFTENRPTVAQAIMAGARALIPYLAAQILLVVGLAIVIGAPIGLAAAGGGVTAAVLVGLLGLVAFIYVMIKFSLLAPVMVIDGQLNPIKALLASWRATKGNSVRLLAFYVLLLVAVMVVAIIFSMVSGLLVAILGAGTAGLMLGGAINGLLGAIWAVLIVAVVSATYRQLVGPSAAAVSATFE